MAYSLYILRCTDGTYYTGITTNVSRRLPEHNGLSGKGAKYTSTRRPVELVYEDSFPSRSEALKEELRIKRLTRSQKKALISEAQRPPGCTSIGDKHTNTPDLLITNQMVTHPFDLQLIDVI